MDILEVVRVCYSVRQHRRKKMEEEKREIVIALINECNKDSELNI